MKFTLNIKPTKYEAPTKDQLVSNITRNKINATGIIGVGNKNFYYNGYRNGILYRDDNKIIVMNLLKVRKKVIQTKDKKDKSKTKSKVINKGHWIAYVYTFDINVLKELGYKRLEQKTRNFVISK